MTRHIAHKHQGFTLIEILVGLVILGIVLGTALLRFDINNPETLLKREASRLAHLMELADQQAIFQNLEIGLLFKGNSYEFFHRVDNKWTPLDDEILKKHELMQEMELSVEIEGEISNVSSLNSTKKKQPQISFFPSGEWTAFEVVFALQDNKDTYYILSNIETGKLEVKRESNE